MVGIIRFVNFRMIHSKKLPEEGKPVIIYTDGSCHTQLETGAWAAIILWKGEKIVLQGIEYSTTHNRMELKGVMEAIDYVIKKDPNAFIELYSDSQYVVRIPERKDKLKQNNFITKKGTLLPNSDLIKKLIDLIENFNILFTKVKAHQKAGDSVNYNREVDLLVRNSLREEVRKS